MQLNNSIIFHNDRQKPSNVWDRTAIFFLLGYLSDPLLCSSLHDVSFLPSLKFIHANWLYLLYYYASLKMSFLYYLRLDSIPSVPCCYAFFLAIAVLSLWIQFLHLYTC